MLLPQSHTTMVRISDKYPQDVAGGAVSKLEEQLRQYDLSIFGDSLKFVRTPRNRVGVVASIDVDSGSNCSLLSREPVLIEFSSVDDIEVSYVSVYPDRIDFPFGSFPHINPPTNGMTPSLCLTRENFADWYSEHTFIDLVDAIEKWFADASSGNLIKVKEGDFYEPFQHHPMPEVIIFRLHTDEKYIEDARSPGFKTLTVNRLTESSDIYVDFNDSPKTADALQIILWREGRHTLEEWFVEYPKTYGGLKDFLRKYGFKCDTILPPDLEKNIKLVFFQVAFVRPAIVLNKESKVDSLYFSASISELETMGDNAPIHEVSAYDNTSPNLARYISATSDAIKDKKILLLGGGAIGSKLAFHLYRSGICNLTICDNDKMLSHNVCRHALHRWTSSDFKANIIKKELDTMFILRNSSITAVTEDINRWLPKQDLTQYDLIIDATASASVFHTVDMVCQDISVPLVHFALSDAGKVGLVYTRFNHDNRMSDYYMHLLQTAALGDEDLQNWLVSEKSYSLDSVRIGEGCHSNTMILSDDVISTHVGIASSIIRNIFDIKNPKNTANLSYTNIEYAGQVFTGEIPIPPFRSMPCSNAPEWNIRYTDNLLHEIRHTAKMAQKKETGGYLMGVVDKKRKVIYILDHFEPCDSVGCPTGLKLGTKGWQEHFNSVRARTADGMVYIGDWHSHPKGSLERSEIDKSTNREILTHELKSRYGICIITNSSKTRAYLIKPSDE